MEMAGVMQTENEVIKSLTIGAFNLYTIVPIVVRTNRCA